MTHKTRHIIISFLILLGVFSAIIILVAYPGHTLVITPTVTDSPKPSPTVTPSQSPKSVSGATKAPKPSQTPFPTEEPLQAPVQTATPVSSTPTPTPVIIFQASPATPTPSPTPVHIAPSVAIVPTDPPVFLFGQWTDSYLTVLSCLDNFGVLYENVTSGNFISLKLKVAPDETSFHCRLTINYQFNSSGHIVRQTQQYTGGAGLQSRNEPDPLNKFPKGDVAQDFSFNVN